MRSTLLGALLIAAAAAADADMALAYHGKLVPAGGGAKISTKVPMTVEFRLYRDEQPGETVPLWGRVMPVRFDGAGMFYVELSDGNGAAVPNAAHERLADAVAAAVDGPITPLCPSSVLRTHPDCTLYLDPPAASKLASPATDPAPAAP